MLRTLITPLTLRTALVAALAVAGAGPVLANDGFPRAAWLLGGDGDGMALGHARTFATPAVPSPLASPRLALAPFAEEGLKRLASPEAPAPELPALKLNLAQTDGLPAPGMPEPLPAPEDASVTEKWWFWAAVGVLVVGTATILILATRSPSAPSTRLGDMEFMP